MKLKIFKQIERYKNTTSAMIVFSVHMAGIVYVVVVVVGVVVVVIAIRLLPLWPTPAPHVAAATETLVQVILHFIFFYVILSLVL